MTTLVGGGGPLVSKSFTAADSGDTLSAGPFNITNPSNGNFTVFGNYQDISFTLTGLLNVSTSLSDVNVTLGGNTITLGNGSNTIYGTLRDITMSDTGGTADATLNGGNDVTVNTLINNISIDLTGGGVGNTITAGNGVAVVYGDMRNLTMTAGGNTAISDPTFDTSPNTIAVTQIQNLTLTEGYNQINLGNGNDTVYGDMRSLNLVATAGTAIGYNSQSFSGPGDGANSYVNFIFGSSSPVNTNFFNFGSNTITVGNGVNVVYGHLQTLSTVATGGLGLSPGSFFPDTSGFTPSSLPGYTDFGLVAGAFELTVGAISETMTMASNTIRAGVGNNTIYGDFQTQSMIGVSGTLTVPPSGLPDNSVDFRTPLQTSGSGINVLTLAGNFIYAGLGGSSVNTIYGNSQDWIFTCSYAGINTAGMDHGMGNAAFSLFDLGGNSITIGNGVNTIYGAIRDFIATASGGTLDGGNAVNLSGGFSDDLNFSFATVDVLGNTISVGNGVNLIYGDMRDLSLIALGGTGQNLNPDSFDESLARNFFNTFDLGHNSIIAGNGTNTIYGTFHDLTLSVIGGTNTSAAGLGGDGAREYLNTFIMGNNVITAGMAGSSVNTIYGDGFDVLLSVAGGIGTGGEVGDSRNQSETLHLGHNMITVGNGSTTVFGDIHQLTFSASGGSADGLGSYALDYMWNNAVSMGGNNIVAGSGATVYGDAQTISFSVQGGVVTNGGILTTYGVPNLTNAEASIINTSINLEGNTIHGGSGGDVIYSNLQNLSFSAINGQVLSGTGNAGAYFSGNINFTDGSHLTDTGSKITFGNDTIVGGSGNDLIIGSDVLNLTGLDAFLKPAGFSGPITWHNNGDGSVSNDLLGTDLNQITFGNELLTGGLGNDTFEFTLLNGGTKVVANQGAAEVTDLGAKDVVQLNTSLIAEHTAAALDADHVATFTNSAAGCLITFNGAGSIMLDGVHFNSFVQMQTQHHLVVS
jgi:hypothetical protein